MAERLLELVAGVDAERFDAWLDAHPWVLLVVVAASIVLAGWIEVA